MSLKRCSIFFQEIDNFLTKVIEIKIITTNCIWISPIPPGGVSSSAVRYRHTWWAHQPCYCLSGLKPAGSDRTPWHPLMQTGTPCGRDNVGQILPQHLEAEEREHCRLTPNISQLLKRYLGYDTDISVKKRSVCWGIVFPCTINVDAWRHFCCLLACLSYHTIWIVQKWLQIDWRLSSAQCQGVHGAWFGLQVKSL